MNLDRVENHTHVGRRFPRYYSTVFRGQALWDPYTHVMLPHSALMPQRQQQHSWKEKERTEKDRKNSLAGRIGGSRDDVTESILTHASPFQPRPLRTPLRSLSASQPIRRESTRQPGAPFYCPSHPSPLSSCWSIEVWAQLSLPSTTRTGEAWGGNRSHPEQ